MAQFFLGEYDVPVDEKGRVFLPAELRRKLLPEDGDTLVVTRGARWLPQRPSTPGLEPDRHENCRFAADRSECPAVLPRGFLAGS